VLSVRHRRQIPSQVDRLDRLRVPLGERGVRICPGEIGMTRNRYRTLSHEQDYLSLFKCSGAAAERMVPTWGTRRPAGPGGRLAQLVRALP
jgi:hypothetical protein